MKVTREQIKEAFKKTIERWEKIIEDVDYYNETKCALCLLESGDECRYMCSHSCPIRLYTGESVCEKTPYNTFYQDRTSQNALAELNFLRKVYIWWMEGEHWKGMKEQWLEANKEEKKEEWEAIGDAVGVELWHACGENRYAIKFFYRKNVFGTMWADGKIDSVDSYKIEKDDSHGEYCLRFFKKG